MTFRTMTFTRSFLAASVLAFAAAPAFAQDAPNPAAAESGEYTSDPTHAYITFSYSHQGYSRPFLRWRDWNATLDWDADKPEESDVEVEIVAASIDSGVDKFDDHLKSADFFEVEKFPTITFKSGDIEKTGDNTGVMNGVLVVKGEEKPVTLDVTFNRADFDERKKAHKIGFSARGKVSRTELGVGKYAPFVGDDVDLLIEVEFVKPQA
ncbi:MAG: YceI family protein [Pseudomonadota bacterium]